MKGQSFYKRLGFAINGLYLAFSREQSFRYHVFFSIGVLFSLLVIRPSPVWWAIGALTVGFVLIAELVNTAIEALADHVHPERHYEIQVVKDIAAAAVLVSSIVALIVGFAFFCYHFYIS